MLNSPPPPPEKSSEWEQDWPTLRAAWNAEAKAGKRAAWRSSSPPAGAGERLQEDGWLGEALKAIPMVAELRAFDNDVTLGQFCQEGWVAKVLGGYWRDKKRPPSAPQPRGGYRGPEERPPANPWAGDDAARFEATKRAMAEKLRQEGAA